MENWKEKSLSLGSVKEKQDFPFKFESLKSLEIDKIEPSCSSCTKIVGYNPETRELECIFNSGSFPMHLQAQGLSHFDTTKTISVTYKGGTSESLYFKIRVYKN